MSRIFKSLRVATLAAVFVMLFAAVCAAGPKGFTLINNTGYSIHAVNIVVDGTEKWSEVNLLGENILANGASVEIKFKAAKDKVFHMRTVFEDKSAIGWNGIPLIQIKSITLNGNGTATLVPVEAPKKAESAE